MAQERKKERKNIHFLLLMSKPCCLTACLKSILKACQHLATNEYISFSLCKDKRHAFKENYCQILGFRAYPWFHGNSAHILPIPIECFFLLFRLSCEKVIEDEKHLRVLEFTAWTCLVFELQLPKAASPHSICSCVSVTGNLQKKVNFSSISIYDCSHGPFAD